MILGDLVPPGLPTGEEHLNTDKIFGIMYSLQPYYPFPGTNIILWPILDCLKRRQVYVSKSLIENLIAFLSSGPEKRIKALDLAKNIFLPNVHQLLQEKANTR